MTQLSTIKKILFYFNISGYKFLLELGIEASVITNDRRRTMASAIIIMFHFTIFENIYDWNFNHSYTGIKIVLVCLILYFTLIDLIFYKDIEAVSANYFSVYNKRWDKYFFVYLLIGFLSTIIFFYRLINK